MVLFRARQFVGRPFWIFRVCVTVSLLVGTDTRRTIIAVFDPHVGLIPSQEILRVRFGRFQHRPTFLYFVHCETAGIGAASRAASAKNIYTLV